MKLQLKSEQIAGMIKTLKEMDDKNYNHIQNWKYLNFLPSGEFVGYSHYRVMPELIHFPPFQEKENSIRYLEFLMENTNWADDVPLETKDDIDNVLYGELVDNSTRLYTFFNIAHRLHGELYWYGLREALNTCWKSYYYRHELRRAFLKDEPHKNKLMTQEEHEVFDQFSDLVDIYRITSRKERDNKDYGVSWTLQPEIAEDIGDVLFKDIYEQSEMAVKHLQVPKSDLIAYWNQWRMQEVIYVPPN